MKRLKIGRFYYLGLIFSVLVVIGFIVTHSQDIGCRNDILDRTAPDFEVIKCSNDIIIEKNFNREYDYSFYDYAHKYEIGVANSHKGYKIINEKLYFIDPSQAVGRFGEGSEQLTLYSRRYFVQGEIHDYWYEDVQKIPKFILVNIKNGEVIPYTKLEDIPENDRKIFASLR